MQSDQLADSAFPSSDIPSETTFQHDHIPQIEMQEEMECS